MLRNLFSWGALFTIALSTSAGPLSEAVQQESFGWMAGKWKATEPSGGEVLVTHEWRLNKNAVVTTVKTPEMSTSGMTFYCYKQEEIRYVAVSDSGVNLMGTWSSIEGSPLLTIEYRGPYGETGKTAYVMKKDGPDRMKVLIYEGYSADNPTGYADMTLQFKKVP